MAFTRWTKTWITIVLVSLLVYDVRWLSGVIISLYNASIGILRIAFWWRYWLDYVLTGIVGDTVRLVGVCLALYAAYMVWTAKKPLTKANKYVALAVLCEGIYFLTLLPLSLIEISRGLYTLLMVGYLLQILLVSPALIILSMKLWRVTETAKANLAKWAGAAGISYMAGIWVNNVFRTYLYGVTSVVFLNAVTTLSLSLTFASVGFLTLLKTPENRRRVMRLFAIALILLGLHFAIFIINSWITNTLTYALLVEIWPVTFLGLGFSLLKEK